MTSSYIEFLKSPNRIRGVLKEITDEELQYIQQNLYLLECNLKVFISYSNEDKEIAGKVKKSLESLGLNSFLAHEDIVPSQEWQKEILNNLKEAKIFIPILTPNFKESDWTDQETGMAIAYDLEIIPISLKKRSKTRVIDPYGFISRYQALRIEYDPDTLNQNPDEIINDLQEKLADVLIHKENLTDKVKNCYVNFLIESESYIDANIRSKFFNKFEPYNKEQLRKIILGYILNDQLNNAFGASNKIKTFINENLTELDPILVSIWEKFNSIKI
ncbi:MAG: toll/interleukin-1 receptor domain-containing protein [Candidatus Nanopusillus acidilobi]